MQISSVFTLNNDWKNLGVQAAADGYIGGGKVKSLTVLNFNATAAYLHFTKDGATNPTTAADGLPLSSDTATAPQSAYTAEDVDLNAVWIHTAGNLSLKYSVIA